MRRRALLALDQPALPLGALDEVAAARALAGRLLQRYPHASIRLLEALAVMETNRLRQQIDGLSASEASGLDATVAVRREPCLRIARRALAGSLADPTCGATRCHRRWATPPWAEGLVPCAEIADHFFYREES